MPYNDRPAMIYGSPFAVCEQLPSAPAAASGFAVFANLAKTYLIGRRNGSTTLFVDPYSLAEKGQTRFIFSNRWDGQVALPGGIVVIKTHA
jgi:HK97 family phage major capsid protein